jgi:mRNA interferase MazF
MTAKVRRVVILSRDDPDAPRRLTTYVPISTQNRGSDYEVKLPRRHFFDTDCVANVQGIASWRSTDETFFLEKLGELPPETMSEIESAVLYAIGGPGS